jgi:hypothetical protein
MVRDLVNSLVAGIKEETSFLSNDALTPTELRKASEFDVGSGILDFKHFPKDVEKGQLFQKFTNAYRAVTRSIRISGQNVLNDIAKNVNSMPTYEDNDASAIAAYLSVLPAIQGISVADAETNASHYNLMRTLAEMKYDLLRLGKGLPANLTPDMQRLSKLTKQLGESNADTDSILGLFKQMKPGVKSQDMVGQHMDWGEGRKRISPEMFIIQITQKDGKARYIRYAANWMMIIDAHILAIEALQEFYKIGGQSIEKSADELFGMGGGGDSLSVLEDAIDRSHDTIRVALSDAMSALVPTVVSAEGRARMTDLANRMSALTLAPLVKNRETRETFEAQWLSMRGMRTLAKEIFAISLT